MESVPANVSDLVLLPKILTELIPKIETASINPNSKQVN
jgi:hypothetical protein